MDSRATARGNRIVIESRTYDARVLGGGRFDVFTAEGVHVGTFSVRGGIIQAVDLGVAGADPVEEIGKLWAKANLSGVTMTSAVAVRPAPPPEPTPEVVVAKLPVVEAPPVEPAPPPAAAAQKGVSFRICRVTTFVKPTMDALQRAIAYEAWLRTQPGVVSSQLVHDKASGKTMSFTVWETREQLTAMRYAKPPADAVQLNALSAESMLVVG